MSYPYIKQINTIINPNTNFIQINALDNEGSLWALSIKDDDDLDWRMSVTDVDWVKLPNLPQSRENE